MSILQSRRLFLKLSGSLLLSAPFSRSLLATAFPDGHNPGSRFHLTARPWAPADLTAEFMLETVEGLCRFAVAHQNEQGAFIDPFLNREHQYATPYLAHAIATLIHAERAEDLFEPGVLAMHHATKLVEAGNTSIPDRHGEFFIAPLAGALSLFEGRVDAETLAVWKQRLQVPIDHIIQDIRQKTNNWRTYPMKGEWVRFKEGLIDREAAIAFIEDGWLKRTQRDRIGGDRWNMYQDWNGHPQSHAVEAVGRGNLLALVAEGYDGPSAPEIQQAVLQGTAISLLLQDPTGQCPPNGRTDNHVFNDVLYQLIFEVMAERANEAGKIWEAGQYRRAAQLALQSIQRWKRDDDSWAGSFFITKNHFDPEERIGYQPASQYSNYSGAVMYHMAEAYRVRQSKIEEQPAPCEIGGYAFGMDERFGSVVANAGGMQVFANLRGDTVAKYETFWTPLGVVRFSRSGWDSRLGPSDGARDALFEEAVTFAPTWKLGPQWVRMAMAAEHYQGTLRVDFQHPLLVKFSILYSPVTGVGGPSFYHDFTVTPDGVFSRLSTPNRTQLGLTLPLLEEDGRELEIKIGERNATTKYPEAIGNGDEQHFFVVNEETVTLEEEESVLSTYGWLRPVRVTTEGDSVDVFVYPRTASDPEASAVQQSFQMTESGFRSVLGRLEGTLYTGRHAAGGFGDRLQLNIDEIVFDKPCGFIVQHDAGRITALETDTDTTARIGDESFTLTAFVPLERA